MSRRTFVVTGGTKGIGLATVRRLTTAGHHTIAMARSAPAQPIPGEFIAVDLADPTTQQIKRFAINARCSHGPEQDAHGRADLFPLRSCRIRFDLPPS